MKGLSTKAISLAECAPFVFLRAKFRSKNSPRPVYSCAGVQTQ